MTKLSALFLAVLIGSSATALAAEPKVWPFAEKAPRDPALGLLQKVDSLEVSVTDIDPKLVTIDVKATAPRPGYTDVTLVNRPGKLNDRIFAFELRGRPPQQPAKDVEPTEMTAGGTYKDAPVGEIEVIEIYAEQNCVAYSLAEKKTVECTTRVPQDETL
ncbi:hypothetical protein A7A08_00241 [Methyloligella halotolerans]|uniref:Uncharacterized protein n=1 Tax=Methyloligella halotolerans TaxID=1177755 RepID=A0A1E2S241_9HYPH|nr:hypothetical protein [Methyloligella halotolerans]ODA68418.1 hypothetical protein A7A08_00241 [Methyloligella halotolerans]